MADVTENTLRAAIKALKDVIAPSVDRDDALANEQIRLVTQYLEFTGERLDLLYERDRFELAHHLQMARTLTALSTHASDQVATSLEAAIAQGTGAYNRAGLPPGELKAASASLACAVRMLVREASTYPASVSKKIQSVVLDLSQERVAFERSWYLPLGFDPAPGEVPPISSVLEKWRDLAVEH